MNQKYLVCKSFNKLTSPQSFDAGDSIPTLGCSLRIVLRVLKSINFDFFSEKSKNIFFNKEFKVTKLSDRMGMRLEGQVLENVFNSNIKSEGLVKGVIQVPSDGNPIIMLSDHGTIGGYPKIANVISADFDKLVQMIPGSVIKFKQVSLDEAEKLFKLYKLETDNLINQI